MHYSEAELFRLLEEVEAQGGHHLDKTHDSIIHTKLAGSHARGVEVAYCGQNALFEVPFDSMLAPNALDKGEFCAIDDAMGRWPRFAAADAMGRF